MKYVLTENEINIPSGVSISVKARNVVVKGPLGEVKKTFKHVPCDIFKKKSRKGQNQLKL